MIVPMKKISIISLAIEQDESLKKLAQVGVMHIETKKPTNQEIEELNTKKEILKNALKLLPKTKKKVDYKNKGNLGTALKVSEKIVQIGEEIDTLSEQKKKISNETDRISGWGNMKPQSIDLLNDNGINLKLFEIDRKKLSQIPEHVYRFIINN